jgi:hypothetical protein
LQNPDPLAFYNLLSGNPEMRYWFYHKDKTETFCDFVRQFGRASGFIAEGTPEEAQRI